MQTPLEEWALALYVFTMSPEGLTTSIWIVDESYKYNYIQYMP